MKTTHNSCLFHHIGLGLVLSFAALGCGSSGGDESTGTATTEAAGTGSSGTSTASTGEPTTGSSGATSTPTSEASTGETSLPGSSSGGSSSGDTGSSSSSSSGGEELAMSFFVSSTGSPTGDLGGLEGADQRCQDLADAVGAGGKTWRAYLSVEKGPDDGPVDARDRIGTGPWYNAKLALLATDVDDLHAKIGDHTLFLDENGEMVPGQWAGSPTPNEHDILTGSNKDGTLLAGKTCEDWTSDDAALFAQVGHSDGLGPNMSDAEMYRPWNSVHENGGCHDTAPKGGAGRVYCFAID